MSASYDRHGVDTRADALASPLWTRNGGIRALKSQVVSKHVEVSATVAQVDNLGERIKIAEY